MLSNGGTASVETARRFPARLLESGLAAGALAAAFYGRATDFPRYCPSTWGDHGEGVPDRRRRAPEEQRVRGRPRLPLQEGLGVARQNLGDRDDRDRRGRRFDREHRSSGPAEGRSEKRRLRTRSGCYGRGGQEPTVTDADLILGYLDPDFFLGGKMQLDRDAALLALEKIARPLGLDTVGAAWGIHQVVNENMANAARVHAVERGKDPRLPPLRLRWGRPRARLRVARALGVPGFIAPWARARPQPSAFCARPSPSTSCATFTVAWTTSAGRRLTRRLGRWKRRAATFCAPRASPTRRGKASLRDALRGPGT